MSENNKAICFSCKHFNPITGCPAFPVDGIPEEILLRQNDHSEIIPGQFGTFIFEPFPKVGKQLC
jgi:hypothetical protein